MTYNGQITEFKLRIAALCFLMIASSFIVAGSSFLGYFGFRTASVIVALVGLIGLVLNYRLARKDLDDQMHIVWQIQEGQDGQP